MASPTSSIESTAPAAPLGPVDFLAVELPDGRVGADGVDRLLDLSDRGVIAILDVEFVARRADGTVERVAARELRAAEGVDLGLWDDASAGLLDDDDVAQLGAELAPGGIAVVIVFENRWVLGLADAWCRDGGRLLGDGGIGVDALMTSLGTPAAG
jgi:hypothetical protein